MNTIAYKIASAIKRVDPDHTESIEVMKYSITILFNTLFIIVMSLGIGWYSGSLSPTLLALSSLALLRFTSGGYHLNSAWACNAVSVFICVIIPHLTLHVDFPLYIINVFNILVMTFFAPLPDKNTQIATKIIPYLKLLSILLVCSNFFFNSEVIGLAFLVQSLTVIPWGRRHEHA